MATVLSRDQHDIWIADQADPKGSQAMVLTCYRASGTLDTGSFFEALRLLGQRHPALCLMIDNCDGSPRAVSAPPEKIPVMVEMCPSWEGVPDDWVARRLEATASYRIDLQRAPALAVKLLVLSANEYVICFCGHHISLDDLSLTVMLRDFGRFYTLAKTDPEAAARAAVPPVTELPLRLDDARRSETLRSVPLPWPGRALKMAGDPSRVAINIPCRAALDRDRVQALRHVAHSHGTTLFCLCTAAYKVLLARYCGVDRVAVGVAYSLRGNSAAFEEVGAWVSYVGVETVIDPKIRIVEMGARFGRELISLREGRSVCPLGGYSATIVRYLAPRSKPDLHEMTVTEMDTPFDSVLVELATSLREVDDKLVILMRGRERLFTKADLSALMEGFVSILDELVANADLTADIRLPLRPDTAAVYARRAQVTALAGAEVDLATAFGHCAKQNATALAVVAQGHEIDYQTLDRTALALAEWMQSGLGLQRGDRLALYLRRGHMLPLLHLSSLLAGLVIVPVDTAYPDDRIAQILQRADCRYAMCANSDDHDHLQNIVDQTGLSCQVATAGTLHDQTPRTARAVASHPDDPAYLIFTSGSTGIPKGVVIPRKALVRLALGCFELPVQPGNRVAQLASPSFDALFIEIWSALLNGGTLVCPDQAPATVEEFASIFRDGRITHAFLTTSVFNLVVDEDIDAFSELSEVAVGGEAMSAPHAHRFVKRFPDLTLRNVYGPTENGALTTAYRIPSNPAADLMSVPIGTPLPGNVVLVLDADGRPVPDGFFGELWLGGPGLALGYDGDLELTASRFRLFARSALGLGDGPDLRLYRTGDKVRWDATGTAIEYHGRIDSQIKFNGFRIEPGEIESHMVRHPDVRRAAVVPAHNGPGGTVNAIWAVYDCINRPDDPEALETSLRGLLAQGLPRFMLPNRYLLLDDGLPLNASGKIDRRAIEPIIAAHGQSSPASIEGYDKRLVSIWSDILQTDNPRDDIDFFAQGGHSVLAMRLLSRVQRELGLTVSVADFLRAPTLRMMELALTRQRGAAIRKRQTGSEYLSLLLAGPEDEAPLFCLPGLLGEPAWINAALPHLSGCGRPILGLRLPDAPLPETLCQIASLHAAEIAKWHRDRGLATKPIIAGFSMGGFLAVALAAALSEAGLPPSRIIVADSGSNLFSNLRDADNLQNGSISNRLASLRRAHVLQPVATPLDFILATNEFPWVRLPPSEDWSCIAQGGVAIHPLDTHHLSIPLKKNGQNLAGLIRGLIDGSTPPERTLYDPWTAQDLGHLSAVVEYTARGQYGAARAELKCLSSGRQAYPRVVLQSLRLAEKMGDTEALRVAALGLLNPLTRPPADIPFVFALVEALDRAGQASLADRLDAAHLAEVEQPSSGLLFQRIQRALNRGQFAAAKAILGHPALSRIAPVEAALIRLMVERRGMEKASRIWRDALLSTLAGDEAEHCHHLAAVRSVLIRGDDAVAEAIVDHSRLISPRDPATDDLLATWSARRRKWS